MDNSIPYIFWDNHEIHVMLLTQFYERRCKMDNETKDPVNRKYGHPRFYGLLEDMAELHSRKNHDYALETEPLSNLKASLAIGIPAWKGCVIRLMDKWDRIKNFARCETFKVKDESLKDTLMDNAVYSLLAIILYEEDVKDAIEKAKSD